MPGVMIHGEPATCLAWDGSQVYLCGEALGRLLRREAPDGVAGVIQPMGDGTVQILRDRLGLGKLFWVLGSDGRLHFAARPVDLTRQGHPFDQIAAVPRGVVAVLDARGELLSEAVT